MADVPDTRPRRRGRTRRAVAAAVAAILVAVGGPGAAAPDPASAAGPCGRVDLVRPEFSHPTVITNPLFPRIALRHVVQLGGEEDTRVRFELTRLPETRVIRWRGERIRTRVMHFVGYTGRRIVEVATDYHAQADDGSVWYFGEDVANYEDGVIADHEGSWLAGRDGPPGMLMPAHPQVCDVFRPENIPGLVLETVTVTALDQTVDGPRGPVAGGITVQEEAMDGTLEDKAYAPGYGEFSARVPEEEERYRVALAVPIDALARPTPPALRALSRGATRVFRSAPAARWGRIELSLRRMTGAWRRYGANDVPELLAGRVDTTLDALAEGVARRRARVVRQAAVDVGHAALDLRLRYEPLAAVERARVRMWRRQLAIDRAESEEAGAASDRAIIAAIQRRMPGA
jgi:hypothetical protein